MPPGNKLDQPSDDQEWPLVSVMTLNWNGKRFLPGLFDSLADCSYPNLEVIMVDNASTDDSVEFVRNTYPWVKILENAENYMYARGNNEGLRICQGKYICLINNDVDVDPGFIEPVIRMFEQHERLAAAQPKILAMADRGQYEYAGAAGGYLDALGYAFARGRLFFDTEKDDGQYDDPRELFWASGACLFLRRSALEETGYIDEDFVLHQEEIDLCWRLRLRDWRIGFVPEAKIWHYGGGTLEQANAGKTYWNYRNNFFLLTKNLALPGLLLRLILRVPLDGVAMVVELLKRQFANAWAIVRAYGWIIRHIPLMLRKRREVQKNRIVPDRDIFQLMYPGSLVAEYFLLGRRKFSDLGQAGKFLKRIPGL